MEGLKRYETVVTARTYYPIYFRISNRDGSLVYGSRNFNEIGYSNRDKVMSTVTMGKESLEEVRPPGRKRRFRIISIPMPREGKPDYVVQVATHLRFVTKSLSHFKWNMLAALPIILILGSLGGWMLARRSLSPIGYITSKAEHITSNNLNERLASRGTDDEMDHLIQTINGMIARLESSFTRMSEFTADASH